MNISLLAKKKASKSSSTKKTTEKPIKKTEKVSKSKKIDKVKEEEEEVSTPIEKIDFATAILKKKNLPNTLLVDDSNTDDHSTVAVDPIKMEELGLFSGDTVLLRGKKRKTTVAVITADENVSSSRIKMTKVVRSNLR